MTLALAYEGLSRLDTEQQTVAGAAEHRAGDRHCRRRDLLFDASGSRILGPAAADLVTGPIIIETMFGAPGLGREFVESISKRDYSVIMGTAIFFAVLLALSNVLVDLSYGVVDPRSRARRQRDGPGR